MAKISIGDTVSWKWINSLAEGEVLAIETTKTEIISKGKLIVRNGTTDNPAIVILHANGNEVLKLQSELI